jgi:hypothetical protein
MKKLLGIVVLGLLWSGSAYAENISMNELLEDGYTIAKHDLIKFDDDAIKIYTLRKKKKIMICAVQIDNYGDVSSSNCIKP